MQNPYYEMTVPVFTKMLENLSRILEKGLAEAAEKGISEADLLASRLAPDMFPLVKQVQIASDNAKGCVGRLTGTEIPAMPDTETTVAELQARITATISFIKSVPQDAFLNAADTKPTLPYYPGKHFTGYSYLTEFALPNFFFHCTAAYAILRKEGVGLGKSDYVGTLSLQDSE